jgi:hypothetical protein
MLNGAAFWIFGSHYYYIPVNSLLLPHPLLIKIACITFDVVKPDAPINNVFG